MRFLSLFASQFKFCLLLASSLLATSVQADVVTVEGDKIKAGDLVVGTASTCTDEGAGGNGANGIVIIRYTTGTPGPTPTGSAVVPWFGRGCEKNSNLAKAGSKYVAEDFSSGDVSVGCWFKLRNNGVKAGNDHPQMVSLSPRNGVNKQISLCCNYYTDATKPKIFAYVGGGSYTYSADSAPSSQNYATGWHYAMGTYDHATHILKLFVDGELVATRADIPDTFVIDGGAELTVGGENSAATRYFNGSVTRVSLWNTVVSEADAKAMYTARTDLKGDETGLIGYWPCEDVSVVQTGWTGTIADSQTTRAAKNNLTTVGTIDWVEDTDYPFAGSSKTLTLTLSSSSKTYDAQAANIAGLVTVKCVEGETETTLTLGTHYTLSYTRGGSDASSDLTRAGEITVTATGKTGTDYEGLSATATYTINPAPLSSLTFTPSSFKNDGTTHSPTVTVMAGSLSVPATTGYTVTSGSVSASEKGTYNVTVTGKGNFTGTASSSWSIVDCQHSNPVPSEYKAATCTVDGQGDDGWYCPDCETWLQPPTVYPALGHDWTDWYVTVAPTITSAGEEARDCNRCHEHETRILPSIGWTFCPWPDHGYGGTSTAGGTGTYFDGVITNSIGQVLNVYFEDTAKTKLIVGAKKILPTGSTTAGSSDRYTAINPDSVEMDVVDLTGGVKDASDSDMRYAITQLATGAFFGYNNATPYKFKIITLPDELEVIGAHALRRGSTAPAVLEEVRYSGSSLKSILAQAFDGQTILKSPAQSFITPNLTTLEAGVFVNCNKLSGSVNLRQLTVVKGSGSQGTFQHTRALGNVTMPNVTEVQRNAFDCAFFNPITFTFGPHTVTFRSPHTFGWTYHNGDSVMRFVFPGNAPVLDETNGPVIPSMYNGTRWKRDDGSLQKRSYFIFDKSRKNDETWKALANQTFGKVVEKGPTTAGDSPHTVTTDLSVNEVTKADIAGDLNLAENEFEVFGVYVSTTAGGFTNGEASRHPIILVTVESSYFEEAQDYTWQNANGGDWAIAGNWAPDTGYPHAASDTAAFNTDFGSSFTVTATADYTIGGLAFANSSPVTLDFGGHAIHGRGGANLALNADQSDVTFKDGIFAFTNGWFSGKGATVGTEATLGVDGATVTITGDGKQTSHNNQSGWNVPLDFTYRTAGGAGVAYNSTNPNLAISGGGSLTVASPAGVTLSNFMLNSVWGHGVVDGGALTYANNGDTSGRMTFANGLVVANGGSVTGASKLVLKGGETDIAAGSTVDFTSLSVEGPTKGVIAAAGGTLGVALTSAATGADLTFAGIALGDVTGQASQTRLTFANGAVGSGALSYSGKSNCTNVFAGGTFTVPSGSALTLGTTPTLKFVLPETGFASAPLTVQGSGALGNDTVIAIDGAKFKGTSYEGGIVPLVKMASAITNLDTLREDATGIPSGMQLALATGDSTMLVLAPSGYTVTFDANGGQPPEQYKSVGYGAQYGTFPEVTRSGYKFVGWFTAIEGGTQKYPFDKVTDTHTLYARWERTRGLILIFGPPVEP